MLARAHEPEGLWIRADRQSAGRGRNGRRWESAIGNLAASTLVRLRNGDPAAATLALVAAVALREAVAEQAPGLDVRIKWPNDLLVGDAKLSGILLDRRGDAVVVGFGVNLAVAPDLADRASTSLYALTGAVPAPAPFLDRLAAHFAGWLLTWREQGFGVVRQRWLAHAHPIGTALQVRAGPERPACDGLFDGIDGDGALRLRGPEGVRIVHAGDVFLR